MLERMIGSLLLCGLFFLLAGCEKAPPISQTLLDAREAYAEGGYLLAERLFEQYLQEEPEGSNRLEAWRRVLDVAWNIRDDKPKAAGLLEAMCLEYGDDRALALEFLSKLSRVYETMGKYDKASDTWHKALALKNLEPRTRIDIDLELARIYRNLGQYDLALEVLAQCRKEAPDNESQARCLLDQSLVFGFMQSYDRAGEALDRLIAMADLDQSLMAQAVFLQADLLERQGKIKPAIKLLEGVRQTYPNRMALEKRLAYLRSLK